MLKRRCRGGRSVVTVIYQMPLAVTTWSFPEDAESDAQTTDQTDKIRDGDHGRAVGIGQWFDPRGPREPAREAPPGLHHSADDHPPPGGEAGGATDQAGRPCAHFRADVHARRGAQAVNRRTARSFRRLGPTADGPPG